MGTLFPTKQSKRIRQQNKIESLVFFMLMVLTSSYPVLRINLVDVVSHEFRALVTFA